MGKKGNQSNIANPSKSIATPHKVAGMVFKGFEIFPRDGPPEEFLNKQAARCVSGLTGRDFKAAHFKTDTFGQNKGRQAAISQLKDPDLDPVQMATDLRLQSETEIANLTARVEDLQAQLNHAHIEALQLDPAAADALHREDLLALRHALVRARNRYLKKTNLDWGLSQVDREKLIKAKASDVRAKTGFSHSAAVYIKYGSELQETFNMAAHSFAEDRIRLALERLDLPWYQRRAFREILKFGFNL